MPANKRFAGMARSYTITPYLFFKQTQKEVKLADKPGSVVDSHSSRRFVTLRSSNLPADDASNVIVSLFDLAPNGVYPATDVATSAVSSYLAISTLPDPLARPSAVYFLWHFPWPHGLRSLTGILLYGARTFLSALARAATA